MPTTPAASDFAGAFAGLHQILAAYAPTCFVVHDRPDYYHLDTRFINPRNRQPAMLGAVRTQKHYVSFHFMPIYFNAPLQARPSPALKKRMQGKACFNFTAPDSALFAELERVTQRGVADFKKLGWG